MPSDTLRTLVSGAVLLSGLLLFPGNPGAATNQIAIRYFPDVTSVFGGQTFADEDVVEDHLDGTVTKVNIGAIPGSAALTAYHVRAGGTQVVSFDTTVQLPGGLVAGPGDVVQTNFDGTAAYSMLFDARANGVPAGAMVNAISFMNNIGGDILLSFDTTVTLGSVSCGFITAADEDVVRFNFSTSCFTLFFDGSAAGVPDGLDLDGVNYVPQTGHLLLSFDTGGTVGGVTFDAGDTLEYTPSGSTWEMAYNASAEHPESPSANLGGADVLTDLDLDELADEYETNTGTYVSQYDTGTNAALADTDSDGYSDGVEVERGSDPNDPGSTPQTIPTLGTCGAFALILALGGAALRALRKNRASR